MGKQTTRTTFVSRGRITGLVRDEIPAGAGQNRTTCKGNRDNDAAAVEEALFYRARLILGDGLPRPGR